MGPNFADNYFFIASVLLYSIGFTCLLLSRNLVKKIIGLNISIVAVYLFLASKGFVIGRAPPIIVDGVTDAALYVNPIPAGMILTGIVISFSVTAFSLALIASLYKRYETLYLDEIMMRVAQEDPE
ncbi:MAG: cation:proton antiporter subunit C [Treponema sp.]|nr:cation:proton antiporter subunit C [Treponema sp.]